MDRPAQALEKRAVVGRGQLAALDVLLQLLLDLAALRVERPRGGLRHDRLVARAGGGLRDPEAHLSRAEDANGPNLHRGGPRTILPARASIAEWLAKWLHLAGGPVVDRSRCPTRRMSSFPPFAPRSTR